MLRWLTRLFGRGAVGQEAPAATPVAPVEVLTAPAGEAPIEVAPLVVASTSDAKETCPECGRTSVFAGPPGHRYCMHCALRQELFDSTTASQ